MYTKYAYIPGSPLGAILADIIALLTGTIDKATLSAYCSQENTYIISGAGTPAGWTATGQDLTNLSNNGSLPSSYWADIEYGAGLFVAIQGGYQNSSLVYTSPDGINWTARSLPVSGYWTRIIWNGSLFCVIGGEQGTTANVVTSPDGITWTSRTIPVAGYFGALAWRSTPSPLFVAMQRSSASTAAMSSPDGITWTARTLPLSVAVAGIAWNGTVFCAVCGAIGASNVALTSPDGITWTQRTLPQSLYWSDIEWNGTVFVALAGGNSPTNICATSPDGITWTQRVMPVATYWRKIKWNGVIFLAIAGGATNTSIYATSPDGITWTQRDCYTNWFWRGIAWSGSQWAIVGHAPGNPGPYCLLGAASLYNKTIKALNADGTSYKYANIDLSQAVVQLRSAETIGADNIVNLCYNSDAIAKSQRLDLANGGIIYLAATARYLYLLSYLTSGATFGSSGAGNFSGVQELSRDDPWNVAPYPTHVSVQSDIMTSTGAFAPYVKSAIGVNSYGASAVLTLQPNYAMAKQILNAAGLAPIHSAVDLRYSNTANFTYTLLGGLMLGGVKRTTDSFGVSTDETVIGSATYVVFSGGAGNPSFRFLVPKF